MGKVLRCTLLDGITLSGYFSGCLHSMLPVLISSQNPSIPIGIYLGTELGIEDFSAEVSGYSFGAVTLLA